MPSHLFVTWSGGGNLPPALAVATELARRGDRVRFLGHHDQRPAVEAAGFDFEPYSSGRPWRGAVDDDALGMFRVFVDAGIGRDAVTSLRREPVDSVVVDCLLLGALAAVEREGVPTVVLSHTLLSFWLRFARNPVLRLLGRRDGLDAVRLWDAAAVNLVTVAPELDVVSAGAGLGERRGNRIWTGSIVPSDAAPARGDGVLVSLSTNNMPGQRAVLQRAIDAAATLGHPLTVTTGPAIDPASLRVPAGTEVHAFLPHTEAMQRSALVIGHGGYGTTATALAHDLPLVMLPLHPLIDQPMVARAVERAGAGIVLPKRASSSRIAAAARRALDEPRLRERAGMLGASIRTANAAERAAAAIATQRVAR